MKLVLDASMALAWIFERQNPLEVARANASLQHLAHPEAKVIVPSLWYTEVANALLVAERRKVITIAAVTQFKTKLAALPVQCDEVPVTNTIEATLSLARTHQLTSYDASYLELALRVGAKLATFDRALIAAAEAVGITVN